MGGIRGQQIRDETIESVDLGSGSIKLGDVSADAVSNQATIDSVTQPMICFLAMMPTMMPLRKWHPPI